MSNIVDLICADKFRVELLTVVSSLNLPDCYIAAGFVRNLVWDYLHGFQPTALNDVDVIYFSKSVIDEDAALTVLNSACPRVKWQLKNQALMHERNLDPPYESSVHAMAYWPELETAVGAKLDDNGEVIVASPFNIGAIFNGFITHNIKRNESVFLQRVTEKKWLENWPMLRIKLSNNG